VIHAQGLDAPDRPERARELGRAIGPSECLGRVRKLYVVREGRNRGVGYVCTECGQLGLFELVSLETPT